MNWCLPSSQQVHESGAARMPTAPIPSMSRGGAAHGRGSWKGMEMPQMEEREESADEKAEEIDGT